MDSVEPASDHFWKNKTIEELASEQNVKPIQSLSELRIDWPEDESIDEFLALIREARR